MSVKRLSLNRVLICLLVLTTVVLIFLLNDVRMSDVGPPPPKRGIQNDMRNQSMAGLFTVAPSNGSEVAGVARARGLHELCHSLNVSGENRLRNRKMYYYLLADDDKKTVYCAVSKCASTTWKNVLVRMHGGAAKDDVKIHQRQYLARQGLVFLAHYSVEEANYRMRNYFKYLIVRHPLDRLVSAWRDKILGNKGRFKSTLAPKIRKAAHHRPGRENNTDAVNDEPITFPEFINYVAKTDPNQYDRHWRSVYQHCHPCHFHYDFVAQVETLAKDLPYLYQRLHVNTDLQLRFLNEHGSDAPHFSTHYVNVSGEQYQKLLEVYAPDMALFNYKDPLLS